MSRLRIGCGRSSVGTQVGLRGTKRTGESGNLARIRTPGPDRRSTATRCVASHRRVGFASQSDLRYGDFASQSEGGGRWNRHDAERTILEVERVRRDTRHALTRSGSGTSRSGCSSLGTAVLGLAGAGADVTSLYWLLAGALTIGIVVRHYARHERALGATAPALDASTAVLLAMFAGILAANLLADGSPARSRRCYVAALGIVALGLVLHDAIEVAAGLNAALWATVLAAVGPGEPGLWSNLGDRRDPRLRRDRRPAVGVTHPAQKLDDTVHQRVRLGILAVLSEASRADFGFLRDTLDADRRQPLAPHRRARAGRAGRGREGLRGQAHAHLGAGDEGRAGRAARRARRAARAAGARGRLKYGQHDGQADAREYPGWDAARRLHAAGARVVRAGLRGADRRRSRRRGRRSPPARTR